MSRRGAKLLRVLLLTAIVVALVLFARTVHWSATWAAIRGASPGLLILAALVNLLSLALKGGRWWIFLRSIGVRSMWLAMRATFAGASLNNLLVAQGGEAARVVFVARAAHVPSERVLATLALERLFELVGYVVLLALAATFLQLPPSIERVRPVAMVALVLMLGLLVYLVRHPEKAELPPVTGASVLARAKTYGRNFLRTLTSISSTGPFVAAMLVSVGAWFLQLATYYLTARAAKFDLSLVGTIAAMLAVNLGFAVRATPGNVGVFQMMYAVTAATFGMDRDQATGVAFLIQAVQILPVTVLGLLAAPQLLFAKRRKAPRPGNVLPGEPQPDS